MSATPFVGWPLGIFLCVLASVFGILGKVLFKLSHLRGSTNLFIWGMFCVLLINPICSAFAYRFAAQSMLAPMAGLGVVWNTVLSPYLLNEQITLYDIIGASFVLTGCVMVGVSASHRAVAMTLDELHEHYANADFIIYFTFFVFVTIFLIYSSWKSLWHNKSGNKETRLAYSALSGIISGQMYFLTGLMRVLGEGRSILYDYITYLSVVGALVCALLGLYLLNHALKLYDALHVIYIYETCYIVAGTISGLCFFHEMESLTNWHCILYIFSLVQIIVGIYILSKQDGDGRQRQIKYESEDLEVHRKLIA